MTTARRAPPYLILFALAWSTTRSGGSTPIDLAVLTAAVVSAFLLTGRPGRPGTALIAVGMFTVWTILAHPEQALDLASLRTPVVVVLGTVTALTTRRCGAEQRAIVLDGMVMIGTVQALGACVQSLLTGARAASLIGNPNALGALLVTTFVVTLRTMPTRAWPLLVVQGVGVLLTGSRLAIFVGLVVAAVVVARGPLRRWWAVVVCWAAVAVGVAVGRFAAAGDDRIALWRAALAAFADAPVVGRGSAPVVYRVAGIRPTTHAHDEILQLGVEYGAVGLGLLVIAGIAVTRSARAWDAWLLVAALPLAASGLTDIGLRIPAVALTAAALGGCAVHIAREGREPPPGLGLHEPTSQRRLRERWPARHSPVVGILPESPGETVP